MFKDNGAFDDDFGFHMEEIDLCWRLWNRGYRIKSATESVVFHLGGGSLPRESSRKVYYNYRNSLKMLWKNYSSSTLLLRFTARIYFDLIAALRELFSGNTKNLTAIIKAHIHFWKSFGKVNNKRKKLQVRRSVGKNPSVMYKKDIVRAYFFKNKRTFDEIMG